MMRIKFSFIILSIITIGTSSSLPTESSLSAPSLLPHDSTKQQNIHNFFGIGFTIGARIFSPPQINSFVSDIYQALQIDAAEVRDEQKNPGLYWALMLRGKIAVYPTSYLVIDAFAHLSLAPKWFYLANLSGGSDKSPTYIYGRSAVA